MSFNNDPYLQLLNIRSAERPPDHYALLGLEQFESDRTKIDDAAGERMEVLQELANSEHMDASQKLLNEVSAARRLLLDATKKIAYDEELRSRQRRSNSQSGSRRSGSSSGTRTRRGKQARKQMLPVGITAVIVIVLAIVVFLQRGGNSSAAGNVEVDWPSSERQGAAVLMDGKPIRISDSQPLRINVPPGRHRLVFQRTGHQDIPKTLNISTGTVRMKLSWVADKPADSGIPAPFQTPKSFPGFQQE